MTRAKQEKQPSSPAARTAWSRRRTVLAALAVALFAWILYLPSLRGAFVWDDIILVGSPEIRTLDGATVKRLFTTNFWDVSDATSGMYRPLTTLSFYTDYHLHENSPAGFHQTNIILNAAVCAVLFLALLEMFSQPLLALLAALWFAAFPMHVQSVAWISGRTDVVATLFAFVALWFHARWRRRGGAINAGVSLLGYALALLGKEIAVVLPVVIAVTELLPRGDGEQDRRGARRWLVLTGMCALTAIYFIVRREVLGSSLLSLPRITSGPAQALALTFSLVARYAYRLVFPFHLNPTPDFPPPMTLFNPHTIVGVVLTALVVACVIRWRRSREFVFAVALLACGLAPVLHIVPANAVMAEHWLYFPSAGYAVLVALAVTRFRGHWRAIALAVFAVAWIACSAATVTGTRAWKDDLTLFQSAVAAAPRSPTAHFDLGVSLGQRGRTAEAIVEFRRATELNPAYADAWSALGRAEDEAGHPERGLEYCARAVELDPTDVRFVNDLGMMQFKARQYAAAARSFEHVLELRPRHDYARFNLGLSLYQQRDFDGAIQAFNGIAGKETDFVNAWFFIAECEMQRGNRDAAAQAASHFLSLHPADDATAARAREIAGQR